MATGPRDTTKFKGSIDILTTETGYLPEYLINGVPIDVSGADNIRELTASSAQLLVDDYLSCTGTFNITLLPTSTAIKRITIKSEIGGGTITVIPDGSDTIEGVAGNRAVTAGTSITIAPVTGDWSES